MIILAFVVSALAPQAVTERLPRTLEAPQPPQVVETYPATGAQVAAGKLAIRVTFDQPMRSGSYSYIAHDPASTPACDGRPMQSADGRSFTMTCELEAGRAYVLGFNDATHRNFTSLSGVPATPSVLRFSAR